MRTGTFYGLKGLKEPGGMIHRTDLPIRLKRQSCSFQSSAAATEQNSVFQNICRVCTYNVKVGENNVELQIHCGSGIESRKKNMPVSVSHPKAAAS